MKFFVVKKSRIILFFIISVLICFSILGSYKIRARQASVSAIGLTVVIDAGHGGRDGGCVGTNLKIKESDVNLAIAKKLEAYLKVANVNVVLTRTNKDGLYKTFGRDYKMEDMTARKKIIEKAEPDLVISIHQNTYPLSSVSGPRVYYYNDDNKITLEASEAVSSSIIKVLDTKCVIAKGDYYILNCTKYPSLLVECCYLTNAEDEKNIANEKYQEKFAYALFCGVAKYFDIITY